ncbi:hypothetical protein L915_05039 [Phytophthora nicotianae]|uniref:Integrase catalytic domain-containing protein n=1 Tax=Phytophthora nicotianae TaxID=4792 RepID=W2JEC2_PHYNI|nr:hypothetical protein L915_05039 [Phytophthora nicotianae]ETL44754.1 hypothetical protein L916_04990 [Phytophthora nicotianae]
MTKDDTEVIRTKYDNRLWTFNAHNIGSNVTNQRVNDMISADLLIPGMSNGTPSSAVLVVMDGFSRYVKTYLLKTRSESGQSVAENGVPGEEHGVHTDEMYRTADGSEEDRDEHVSVNELDINGDSEHEADLEDAFAESVGHVSDLTAEDDTEHDNREGSNYDWLFGPSDDREII